MSFFQYILLLSCASTLQFASAKPISLELTANAGAGSPKDIALLSTLISRRSSIDVELSNVFSYYTAELSVGTPAQKLKVLVDTGSSDLWLMAKENPYCSDFSGTKVASNLLINCSDSDRFSETQSSSYTSDKSAFSISYGDSTFASGVWSNDTMSLGGRTIDYCQFGLATEANSSTAVLGVGLANGESTVRYDNKGRLYPTYDNLPMALKRDGTISTNSYSLWLNSASSSSGSILFGGLDNSKYAGDLSLIPIINDKLLSDAANATSLSVMLHGVSAYNSDLMVNDLASFAVPVLIDSGTTMSYLPEDVITLIGKQTNGTAPADNSLGLWVVKCSTQGGVLFDFSGTKTQVPYSEMMLSLSTTSGGVATDSDGNKLCALGLQPATTRNILGISFLRSVYAVFDLDNLQMGLAPAEFGSTASSAVVAIETGIPTGVKAASYSSTAFTTSIKTLSGSYSTASYKLRAASLYGMSSSSSSTSTSASITTSTSGSVSASASTSAGSSSSSQKFELDLSMSKQTTYSKTTSSDDTTTSTQSSGATNASTSATSSSTAIASSSATSASSTTSASKNGAARIYSGPLALGKFMYYLI